MVATMALPSPSRCQTDLRAVPIACMIGSSEGKASHRLNSDLVAHRRVAGLRNSSGERFSDRPDLDSLRSRP